MSKGKVNVFLMCLASIFFISGMIAFKRINKTRLGIIVYVVSIVLSLATIPLGLLLPRMILNVSLILSIFSFLLPIAIMNKSCKQWNSQPFPTVF